MISSERPLRIITVVRKLDGYTQSNLIQCDDGRLYVAKLYPNPYSSNSLANEAIGATLLTYLEIPTPVWRFISISSADIRRFPQLSFIVDGAHLDPQPGLHFASQYLADPDHTIVDYLERPFDVPILNVTKFLDMYIFDIWANHRDRRQYVYRRSRESGLGKIYFIDNSHLFGNSTWAEPEREGQPNSNIWTKPLTHTYDVRVARLVQQLRRKIPEALHHAIAGTPSEWHGSDIVSLEAWLLQRLDRLKELVKTNLEYHKEKSRVKR